MATRNKGTVTIYSNAPFDKTYKHVVDWDNHQQLDDFLDHDPDIKHWDMPGSAFQNINKPIKWDSSICSFDTLCNCNYIRIQQEEDGWQEAEAEPDPNRQWGRIFYAYITNIEYLNDGCAEVYYSIDMWNTYKWYVHYGDAFIKRGFVKELNDQGTDFTPMFRAVKNVKEDIGGDGANNLISSDSVAFLQMEGNDTGYIDDSYCQFIVFTAQPKDAKSEGGTLLGAWSQYKYYILAYNPHSRLCFNININGKEVVHTGNKSIDSVYKELASDSALVGTNSLVVDSEIYSYIGIPFKLTADGKAVNFSGAHVHGTKKGSYLLELTTVGFTGWKPQYGVCVRGNNLPGDTVLNALAAMLQKHYGADVPFKILASPFMKCYFTNGKGAEKQVDLMDFNTLNMPYLSMYRFGGVTNNGHEQYGILRFSRFGTDDGNNPVVYENAQMIDDSPRDVPIILDSYTEYLNANRNQLANVRANAKMNERLAKEGNAVALGNTERSLNASSEAMAYKNARSSNLARQDKWMGTAGGAVGGLMSGGLLGGLAGGVGGYIKGGMNEYKTNYNNQTAAGALAIQNAASAANARANYAFKNEVATNQYEQTIRTQNAMLADMKNHNDQVAHEGSNFLWAFENHLTMMHWQLFTCQDGVMQNVIYYFKLFGYAIDRYGHIKDWLHTKTNFSYVRTANASVTGHVAPAVVETINKMFDAGVTVWNNQKLQQFKNRDIEGNQWNPAHTWDINFIDQSGKVTTSIDWNQPDPNVTPSKPADGNPFLNQPEPNDQQSGNNNNNSNN